MGKTFKTVALIVGFISAVLGIAVVVNDEVRSRIFPDLNPATKADVEEQMRLSEARISSVVEASITAALAGAEARGENVSADEKTNYEAALTSLLASEDPTLTDAKFLALSGQSDAAAETLVTLAEDTSGAAEPIPEKDRAEMLRNAGDILVPSDPKKALAAYRKAQTLDPDNPILATRIQQLETATAQVTAVTEIPNAKFEYDGLLFELDGCETDEVVTCVLSVTNSTPDTASLAFHRVWAINEHSRWMQNRDTRVRASNHYTWNVPSLEASQVDIRFSKPANVLQVFRMNLNVNNVNYVKTFRDLPVRGGRDTPVRQMQAIDEGQPDRAFSISDVQFHFLGCSNPDAPVCRIDLVNTGKEDARVSVYNSGAYDSQSVMWASARPDLDISQQNAGDVPPGITTGWRVNFRHPMDYMQVFELNFAVNGRNHMRVFRDLPLSDGAAATVKTFAPEAAVSPEGLYEVDGVQFAFRGCENPDAPRCLTDVYNPTDKFVRLFVSRADATVSGDDLRSSSNKVEMSGSQEANIPPGLTTTLINEFRTPITQFDTLELSYSADRQSAGATYENVVVE